MFLGARFCCLMLLCLAVRRLCQFLLHPVPFRYKPVSLLFMYCRVSPGSWLESRLRARLRSSDWLCLVFPPACLASVPILRVIAIIFRSSGWVDRWFPLCRRRWRFWPGMISLLSVRGTSLFCRSCILHGDIHDLPVSCFGFIVGFVYLNFSCSVLVRLVTESASSTWHYGYTCSSSAFSQPARSSF